MAKKRKAKPDSQPQSTPGDFGSNSAVQRAPAFDQNFKEDLGWWYKNDASKASKILDLVTDIVRHPFEGLGKPEPLKYIEPNTWSRRIDLEHRLVYRVTHTQIDFLACRYHYN